MMLVFRKITCRRFVSWSLLQCRDASQKTSNKPKMKDVFAGEELSSSAMEKSKSALYVVTRSGQGGVMALVQPDVDFDKILKDTDKLKQELSHRNVKFDIETLKNGWCRLKEVKENIKTLEEEKQTVTDIITSFISDKSILKAKNEAEVLKEKGKALRNEIKRLKDVACDIEDAVIVPAFKKLPNFLHENTPIDREQIVYEEKKKRVFSFAPKSHVEIGEKNGDIILSNVSPGAYYLRGKAAVYELEILKIFNDYLLEANFTPFSNPDFSKPLIVEACEGDPLSTEVLSVQSKESVAKDLFTGLYLTGSASLAAFCAYHTRAVVPSPCVWPLQYFTVGRHYRSLNDEIGAPCDLLRVVQSSRVHFFVATENVEAKGLLAYQTTLQLMIKMYSRLGFHFRVVNTIAEHLHKTEKLRSSFQMWLPSAQKYTEVAYISICGDYVSRRLLCQYRDGENKNYLYMIHGVAVDVPRILACVVENCQTEEGRWVVPGIDIAGVSQERNW